MVAPGALTCLARFVQQQRCHLIQVVTFAIPQRQRLFLKIISVMPAHEFHLFRVLNPVSGKWAQTRYKMTNQTARERYGDGNYQRIERARGVIAGSAESIPMEKNSNRSTG